MARLQPALPLAPPPAVSAARPAHAPPPPVPAARDLWCAVVLPQLPLEVRPAAGRGALAVFDPVRRMILAANAPAAAAGVRPGQSTATAWSRCATLTAFVRDPASETQALSRLAGWAAQFSPRVSVAAESVVFEIGASRRLFGGLDALLEQVDRGLTSLGYTTHRACAPTPLAALWLARAGREAVVTDTARLAGALAPLPLSVLALGPTLGAALAGCGLRRVGELVRLPRAGLSRRYGAALPAALDRALGRRPDPRPAWVSPPVYAGALELPLETTSLRLIALAYRRLAEELAGYLHARDRAARRLELTLETERQVLETTLECHAPLRDPERLLALITTRLEAVTLPAPVRRVALRVSDFAEPAPARELPVGAGSPSADFASVQARLVARLGAAAVVRLALAPDHRPERATQTVSGTEALAHGGDPRSDWPLLLQESPQRLVEIAGAPSLGGRLEALGGPERIESGWWDGVDVARDYYRMRAPRGATLWVYRDRRAGGWYLHGAFA